MTTLADFLIPAPGGGPNRLPCQACGTWTCTSCGWQRHGANLHYPDQDCARCHGTHGTFTRTRHRRLWTWEQHNPVQGPACVTWHQGDYEPFAGPCEHPSCKAITWGHL